MSEQVRVCVFVSASGCVHVLKYVCEHGQEKNHQNMFAD